MRHPILCAAGALLAALASLAAAGAHAAAPFAPPSAGEVVIYRGVNLIDGRGGPLRRDMAIVVDGERIKAVLPDRKLSARQLKGAEVVDLSGAYVLPGLIDSHEHLRTPDRGAGEAMMRRDLYAGVTAVRDMADDLRVSAELAKASRAGEIPGPDIYAAVLVGGPSLFANPRIVYLARDLKPGTAPWAQSITQETDLKAAMARARATGAVAIKVYANLPPNLVGRITAEAHRQGLRVWAHGSVFPTTPLEGVRAGVDSVSHICDLAYQVTANPPKTIAGRFPVDASKFENGDNAEMAALFREMRRRGTILDATDRVYLEHERHPPSRPVECTADLAARLTAQAYREGVLISTGTDGFAPIEEVFPPLYDELEFMVDRAGMSLAAVIRSATLVGAMAAGEEKQMGTIAPGKLANMMVVARNPLEDIRNLRSVSLTIKRGKRFPRTEFRPITPEEMGR